MFQPAIFFLLETNPLKPPFWILGASPYLKVESCDGQKRHNDHPSRSTSYLISPSSITHSEYRECLVIISQALLSPFRYIDLWKQESNGCRR